MIVLDDMIAEMLSNRKRTPTITELFIRGRKLIISFGFTLQFYFVVPRNTILNFTHYCIMKIPNKQEL